MLIRVFTTQQTHPRYFLKVFLSISLFIPSITKTFILLTISYCLTIGATGNVAGPVGKDLFVTHYIHIFCHIML